MRQLLSLSSMVNVEGTVTKNYKQPFVVLAGSTATESLTYGLAQVSQH